MKSEKIFAGEVAFFNSLGFCLAVASSTFLGSRVQSVVGRGPRTYPMGYWICAPAILLFAATFVILRRSESFKTRVFTPAIVLLLFGFGALFNFLPEFPEGNVALWILIYSLVSIVACFIHYTKTEAAYLAEPDIPSNVKLERVKQSIVLWRSVAFSLTVAYVGLLFPWTNFIWDFNSRVANNREDVNLHVSCSVAQLVIFSIYFLAGVIGESFKKTASTAELLLNIREPPQRSPE